MDNECQEMSITPRDPDYKPVNERQRFCIELLLLGKSQTEVANIIDVQPETISRWKKKDNFIYEYEKQKNILLNSIQERVLMMVHRALDTILENMDPGCDYQAKVSLSFLDKVSKIFSNTN